MRTSAISTDGRFRPGCLSLYAMVLRGRSNGCFRTAFAACSTTRAVACSLLMALGNHECCGISVRRQRITSERAQRFFEQLAAFDFQIAAAPSIAEFAEHSSVASRHQLTAYDAAYLVLAKQLGVPLATLDEDLKTASPAEGITIL